MKSIITACIALVAVSMGGCTSYQLSQTSAQGWGQIAAGAGQVISDTEAGRKADARIAETSARISQYCGALQAAAMGASIFSPEKYRQAAIVAQQAVDRYCSAPYQNATQVLQGAAATYADVIAIQQGAKTTGGV